MSIGSQIKKRLALLDMCQAELAIKTGLTEACISMIVTSKREPHIQSLRAICIALNCPADYLLELQDFPNYVYNGTGRYEDAGE